MRNGIIERVAHSEERARGRIVALVSALPPPYGGVGSQTEILVRRGLPQPFRIALVNTTVGERHVFAPSRLSVSELKRTARIILQTLSLLLRRDTCLMHLNFTPTRNGVWRDILLVMAARVAGKPVVLQVHSNLSEDYVRDFSWPSLSILRAVFALSTRVLVLTPESKAWVTANIRACRPIPVPNYVEEREPASNRDSSTGGMKVLFAGGIMKMKGVWDLVEAVAEIPGVSCELVGAPLPAEWPGLQALIGDLRLGERIDVVGPLPNAEVRSRMGNADLFVLPSYLEAFPISILEAMAEGLPVVATSVGAIPELVVDGEGGLLVAPGDVRGLAEAIERVRTDTSLRERMGAFNRERIRSVYSFDTVSRTLVDIYRSVLPRQGKTVAVASHKPNSLSNRSA